MIIAVIINHLYWALAMCFEDSNSIILTLLMKKLGPREVKYVAQDHIATQDLTASKWKLRDLTQEWVGGEVRRNERDKKNKKEKEKKKLSDHCVH